MTNLLKTNKTTKNSSKNSIKTSKTGKKPRLTQSLNPARRSEPSQILKPNGSIQSPATQTLWESYLKTRTGTEVETLEKLPHNRLAHYAQLGCYKAQRILESFSSFISLCQIQLRF
jgi:hypothetical protein